MTTLSSAERATLEKAVVKARGVAEAGVRKRFASLDLTADEAPGGLNPEERKLRTALRRRAANLGKGRVNVLLSWNAAVAAGEPFLVEELAYETWHRMLFARFLAENGLLVHPELGITLSVGDIMDLAAETGDEPWELAASFAANRLPGLFHLTTPLRLATEDRHDLATILGELDADIFTASDALGWVYQFWQAKRKAEVNASGEKITGNTLPPVTQLFTEDYMVDFLLQNSLGAWYVTRHPDTPLKNRWPYLRYRPAAPVGTDPVSVRPPDRQHSMLPQSPLESVSDIPTRRAAERTDTGSVPTHVTTWRAAERTDTGSVPTGAAAPPTLVPAAGTFPTWPDDVARVTVMDPCCGSGHFLVAAFHLLVAIRMEVENLAPDEAADSVLRDNLYGLELDARCTQIATFAIALEAWKLGGHPEVHLPHIACSGIPVSGQRDDWVRLARGDGTLANVLEDLHHRFTNATELGSLIEPRAAIAIGDLWKVRWENVERRLQTALARETAADPAASIFADTEVAGTVRAAQLLSRTYTLVATNVPYLARGSHGDVLKKFAEKRHPEAKSDLATLFLERCLRFVAPADDDQGNPVGAGTVAAVTPQNWLFLGAYQKLRQTLLVQDSLDLVARLGEHGFESSQAAGAFTALFIITAAPPPLDHTFTGLDASAAPDPAVKAALLRDGAFTIVAQGSQRENPDQRIVLDEFDNARLLREYAGTYQGLKTGDDPRYSQFIWEGTCLGGRWQPLQSTTEHTQQFAGMSQMVRWEHGNGVLQQSAGARIQGLQAWGKQGVAISQMRLLPASRYTGEIFDSNMSPIVPKNPDHLPAIWAFCSSPEFNIAVRKIDAKLNVTNATLVKVPFDLAHWQRVAEERYPDGLPAPYSSDPTQWLFNGKVPGSDQPLQVAMARLLGYRWPEQADDGMDDLADPDGIVCLPSVYQEPPAHQRLAELLQRAYGDAWSPERRAGLLRQVEAPSLEAWLRDRKGFFTQHVRIFHNRPFLWQISDGRKDGFAAVVNYHRLDAAALAKLIYTYLGDWITRQQRAVEAGEAGAPARLEAATALKAKLIAIAEGEPPYDIYVRWKSLAEQPIGWNPDLNDGVRLNIRPFIEAGVLAARVTVNWNKDRGKDPAIRHEPLLAEAQTDRNAGDLAQRIRLHCSVDRYNNLHFSRKEKERARAALTPPLRGDPLPILGEGNEPPSPRIGRGGLGGEGYWRTTAHDE